MIGAALVLSVVLSGPAAVPPQETDQQPLQYEVSVILKLVQVYVTDRGGHPVTDLTIEDFELYDNDERRTLSAFEKHVFTRHDPNAGSEGGPVVSPPPRLNRKYFLFFDFAFNTPAGILKSKEAALHFIDTALDPTDEVGVVSYSAVKNLVLNQYLTDDHQEVRRAVEEIGGGRLLDGGRNTEREYWRLQDKLHEEDELSVFGFTESKSHLKNMEERGVKYDREDYKVRASKFSLRMKDFAKTLRYIPGTKNIILFSTGIPHSLMYGKAAPPRMKNARRMTQPGDVRTRNYYEAMLKELSDANCTVFTLNAEELRSTVRQDDDMVGGYPFSPDEIMGGESLKRLSEVTGGRHFRDLNDREAVSREINDLTGSYYTLGYSIHSQWDGKYHKIKVKVGRKGCRVHAQAGYFNPKPFATFSDMEKRLHLADLALSDNPQFQVPLEFPLAAWYAVADHRPHLLLFSSWDRDRLEAVLGPEVEVVSLILDKQNRIVSQQRSVEDLSRLPKGAVIHTARYPLAHGGYTCRVVLRNLETGRGAVASVVGKVGRPPESGIELYPPLLLQPDRNIRYLGTPPTSIPFNPGSFRPFPAEWPAGRDEALAVLRCATSGIPEPEFRLAVYAVNRETGNRIPISSSMSRRRSEAAGEILWLKLLLGELEAGSYYLYILVQEMTVGARAHETVSILVR